MSTYSVDSIPPRVLDAGREKPLTAEPIWMLILATTGTDIKTVDKYWLYRKPGGKCQFPSHEVALSTFASPAGDSLLASKTHRVYIFHAAKITCDAMVWIINPPYRQIFSLSSRGDGEDFAVRGINNYYIFSSMRVLTSVLIVIYVFREFGNFVSIDWSNMD